MKAAESSVSQFLLPQVLDSLHGSLDRANEMLDQVAPNLPKWLGETANVAGGGAYGLSDRFVSGFLWVWPCLPTSLHWTRQALCLCKAPARDMSRHCWARHVTCVSPPCCDTLLAQVWKWSNLSMSQHGGQTHTTCCAQRCWDMLRSFNRGLSRRLLCYLVWSLVSKLLFHSGGGGGGTLKGKDRVCSSEILKEPITCFVGVAWIFFTPKIFNYTFEPSYPILSSMQIPTVLVFVWSTYLALYL